MEEPRKTVTLVWDGKQWVDQYTRVVVTGVGPGPNEWIGHRNSPVTDQAPEFTWVQWDSDQHILVMVATEYGAGAFWLHELKHIEDLQTGGSVIVLEPNADAHRTLRSVWGVGRIIEAINAAVG